jgi:electron transport complex protein RnfC
MRAAASCPDAQGLVEVVVIPTKYPSGSEKQLIRLLTGLEVPSGGIPLDLDISCVNTGTAAAIADAVLEGRPLIDRVVTLTGRSLARPGNYRIRLGTLATDALRFAGLEEATIARLIMGGPMMGHSILHTDAPVIKTTNCLIAGTADEFPPPPPAMPCIRCGHCEQVCPAGLLPQQLYLYARGKDHEKLRDHHLMDCIECGACAYVCESHIPLVQYYRASKADIRSAEAEKRKSDRARFRFETRKTRLEQEAAEREAKRKANAERATRLREQKHQQAKAAPPSDNQESGV